MKPAPIAGGHAFRFQPHAQFSAAVDTFHADEDN